MYKLFINKMKEIQVNFKDDNFLISFLEASCFVTFALVVNYYAVRRATLVAGPRLEDIIFSNFLYINTSYIDYYVAFIIGILTSLVAFFMIKYLIFFKKATALLILVRDFFINLTYLGIPEGIIPTKSFFTQGGDLFFSGHVAFSFLAALVFWNVKYLRYFFLLLTFLMGVEVLLGRYHYSIDVFAAPFITYGVYIFSKNLFKKDYNRIFQ